MAAPSNDFLALAIEILACVLLAVHRDDHTAAERDDGHAVFCRIVVGGTNSSPERWMLAGRLYVAAPSSFLASVIIMPI